MFSPPRIHKIQLLSIGEGGLLSTFQLRSEQGSFKERRVFARVAKGNKPLELDPPTGDQLGLQICNGIKERQIIEWQSQNLTWNHTYYFHSMRSFEDMKGMHDRYTQ